jgi:hypothetical protein
MRQTAISQWSLMKLQSDTVISRTGMPGASKFRPDVEFLTLDNSAKRAPVSLYEPWRTPGIPSHKSGRLKPFVHNLNFRNLLRLKT